MLFLWSSYHPDSLLNGLPTSTFSPYGLFLTHQPGCPVKSLGPPVASITPWRLGSTKPYKIWPYYLPDLTSFYSSFQPSAVSQTPWAHSSLRTFGFWPMPCVWNACPCFWYLVGRSQLQGFYNQPRAMQTQAAATAGPSCEHSLSVFTPAFWGIERTHNWRFGSVWSQDHLWV